MDCRRTPGDWEKELIALGSMAGWGIIPVVTKIDKLSRNQRKPAVKQIAQHLGLQPRQLLACSSHSKEGMDKIWNTLERFIQPLASSTEDS